MGVVELQVNLCVAVLLSSHSLDIPAVHLTHHRRRVGLVLGQDLRYLEVVLCRGIVLLLVHELSTRPRLRAVVLVRRVDHVPQFLPEEQQYHQQRRRRQLG